jgi:hypothetical protein
MNKYKVVKDESFNHVYDVYKRRFCFWIYKGYFCNSSDDLSIQEQAREHLERMGAIKKHEIYFEA